jgi:hypothetical protein
MGTVSAEFKAFMDKTSQFWENQPWKDKLAAAFTNSGSQHGDKLNTLVSLLVRGPARHELDQPRPAAWTQLIERQCRRTESAERPPAAEAFATLVEGTERLLRAPMSRLVHDS